MNRFQNLPMNARKARMGSSLRPRDGTHPDANRIYDASLTLAPLSDATRRRIGLRIIDGKRGRMAVQVVSWEAAAKSIG